MQGYENGRPRIEGGVSDVLVEEWFKEDDFVFGTEERCFECVDSFVCAGCYYYFCVGVDGAFEGGS